MNPLPARRNLAAAALFCLAAALSACASGPEIRTHADPTAQLSSYRSYGFVAEPGTNRAGYSTPVTSYFMQAIRREMDARGYRYTATAPDLLVNFSANAIERAEVRTQRAPGYGYSGYYGYRRGLYAVPVAGPIAEVETVHYKVGTANVDVVDAARKQLIWEGVAEGRLSNKVMANPEPAISAAITDMFAQFPGRAAP
jgi:hypothetical protein